MTMLNAFWMFGVYLPNSCQFEKYACWRIFSLCKGIRCKFHRAIDKIGAILFDIFSLHFFLVLRNRSMKQNNLKTYSRYMDHIIWLNQLQLMCDFKYCSILKNIQFFVVDILMIDIPRQTLDFHKNSLYTVEWWVQSRRRQHERISVSWHDQQLMKLRTKRHKSSHRFRDLLKTKKNKSFFWTKVHALRFQYWNKCYIERKGPMWTGRQLD